MYVCVCICIYIYMQMHEHTDIYTAEIHRKYKGALLLSAKTSVANCGGSCLSKL